MSLDARPMTSSASMDSFHKRKRDKRRKSRLKRWSKPPRVPAVQREFTILPTRKTLTYAEAQKFVDVLSDGQVHRLNISDSIEVETSKEVIDDIEKEQDDGEQAKDDAPVKNQFDIVCKSIDSTDSEVKRQAPFRLTQAYLRCFEKSPEEFDEEVEYDVDEEDIAWLKLLNDHRKATKLQSVSLDDMELVLDRLEKESHTLTMSASIRPENDPSRGKLLEGSSTGESCCVCREMSTSATNSILVCDSCGLSVHQDCYGVPYHPDGQWLCKKCLKSPSSPVKCCLCPCSWKDKEGPGAMKQTSDGRWVHMVCALFIPEISFGSNVYLEPVERLDKVPKWRHEMKCHGCNKAGHGACLGCQAPSCPQSFHALCAIRNGCYVRLVGSSSTPGEVEFSKSFMSKRTGDRRKRIFFCPSHIHLSSRESLKLNESASVDNNDTLRTSKSEPDISLMSAADHDSQTSVGKSSGKKAKVAKRLRKNSQPNKSTASGCDPLLYLNAPITIPNLSQESLANIASHLSVRDRQQVMMRIHRYWLLKRHNRQGFPLIQRLQQVLLIHHMIKMQSSASGLPSVDEESMKSLKKLRQDYEKVRLLLELIRKREKLKVEMLKMKEAEVELTLQPFCRLLRNTLEQLQSKDAIGLFAHPVTEEEAPGYHDAIENPMDYSTMAAKIDGHAYKSMKDFRKDFDLIIDNCLEFNGIESPLYKIAIKHQRQCSVILEAANRMCDRANFCPITGLHAGPVLPSAPEPKDDAKVDEHEKGDRNVEKNGGKLESNELDKLRSKLDDLNKRLDVLHVVRTKGVFQRVKQLKKEISLTKRRMTFCQQQQKNNSCNATIALSLPSADSSLKKPDEKDVVPPRNTRKRNVCRSLEEELVDSTVREKSSASDEGNSTSKRPRLSSDATELLSASSLSSATILTDFGGSPQPPNLHELAVSKFRPASRRSRLTSKTNLTHLKAKSPDRKTHSTPESVSKIKITNSLLSKTLSFISPVRGDAKCPLVSDENKEPLANDKMLGTCHMRLRSFAPIKDDGVKPSRLIRSKRYKKCSTSKEPQGKDVEVRDQCSVILADVSMPAESKLRISLPDLVVVPLPPQVRTSKRIQGRIKVESSTKNGLSANGDINNSVVNNESLKDDALQKGVVRRLTRSSSMLSQNLPQPSEKDSILTECSSPTDHHLIKSNFIERSSNLSPEDEKMLTISPIVLVEKSSAKKTKRSTEEIDSSYESSYSFDSTDSSSTRKETTEVQDFPSPNDSNISCSSKSIRSSDTEPSPNQNSILCESKGENDVEKTSLSSSSTCSKDAEDLVAFLPGDVVWAKTKGYPWYPAVVVTEDCQPAEEPSVYFQNLTPPETVSSLRSKFTIPVHLVRFFDKRKNWQWLPRSKLDAIGTDQKFDKERIASVRQSIVRKDIKRAYDLALNHRRTAHRKTLDNDGGKAEKSPTKRKVGNQRRQSKNFEKGQDSAKEIGVNATANKQNDSSESTVDSVLEARNPLPTSEASVASQQPVMNCSQQFLNMSFQSEKLDADLSPNLQLVISQQPKMLSCTQ